MTTDSTQLTGDGAAELRSKWPQVIEHCVVCADVKVCLAAGKLENPTFTSTFLTTKRELLLFYDTFPSHLWLDRFQRGNVRALGSLPAGVKHFPLLLVCRRFADVGMPRLKKNT